MTRRMRAQWLAGWCCFAALLSVPAVAAERAEVFRAVLDGRPRAVVVHLGNGYWLGWDAARCAPYKVWQGSVALKGAVYDTQHGPTPGSVGRTLWLASDEDAWERPEGGVLKPRFKGFRHVGGGVEFDCALEGATERSIRERAELVVRDDGAVSFSRSLELVGDAVGMRSAGVAFGALEARRAVESSETIALGWGEIRRIDERTRLEPGTNHWGISIRPAPVAMETDQVELAENGEVRLSNLALDPAARVPHALGYSVYPYLGFEIPVEPVGPAASAFGPVDLLIATAAEPTPRPLVRSFVGEATENLQAGPVGMSVEVGPDPVTVHGLGRYVLAGNRGRVGIRLQTSRGRVLAEGTLDLAAEMPGSMAYAPIDPPVVLEAGQTVHVLTDQDFGGNVVFAPGLVGPRVGVQQAQATASSLAAGTVWVDGAPVATEPGFWLRVWELPRAVLRMSELVPGQLPNLSQVVVRPELPDELGIAPPFAATLDGFIEVADGQKHTLRWPDGPGVQLQVAGKPVQGGEVELEAGVHSVRVELLVREAPARFALTQGKEVLSPSALATRAGVVRITAPGTKRVTPLDWNWREAGVEGLAIAGYFVYEQATSWFQRNVLGNATDDGRSIVYDVGGKLSGVHPSFALEAIRPPDFQPKVGGMAFLPDGRLAISCWEPEGGVYLLSNVLEGASGELRVQRIAHGLLEPLGLHWVDDALVVMQKPELTRLVDHDGDDIADEYRAVTAAWGVTQNFHEFGFGIARKDGFLYGTLATAINPGGPSSPNQHLDRGRVFRVRPDGTDFDFVASGLRTPNGIGPGPDGAVYVADNQGDWLPASKIVRVETGAFFGNRSVDPDGTRHLQDTPPVFWLPQFEIGNSPSQVGHFRGTAFAGQLLWGDVTHGGLKRGFVEEIGGIEQGAVFRFTQGLEAGVNRFAWGTDGNLYVGGVGSTGNWNQIGKRWYGLQRLRHTGEPSFEPLAVRIQPEGFEVEFTEPLGADVRLHPEDVQVAQWRYEPTPAYGGPKIDEHALEVTGLEMLPDRTRVRVNVAGLAEGHVVYLSLPDRWRSRAGRKLWTHEAWYTLHRLPAE